MDTDPVASMRIWAVELELGGRIYEVPPLPAADWYPMLVDGDILNVLGLIDGDGEHLDEAVLAGEVDMKELTEALTATVEQVAGRSLHATLVLLQTVRHIWPAVGGELARRGFRWDQAPLAAALDAIYIITMALLKKQGREKFQALLDQPQVEQTGTGRRRPRINREEALADFESMAGPRPAGAPTAPADPGAGSAPRQRAALATPPVPATGARSARTPPRTPRRPQQRPPRAR